MNPKTHGWKTYTDLINGFSFQYPSGWHICKTPERTSSIDFYVVVSDTCENIQGDPLLLPTNYFLVRHIAVLDLNDIQFSDPTKSDTGWKIVPISAEIGSIEIRNVYYQSKAIVAALSAVSWNTQSVIDTIALTFSTGG